MADDEQDPLAWISRYLGSLAPFEDGGMEAIPIDEGARWRVEEPVPGRWAVLPDGEEGEEPAAVFDDRRMAYVAAAVFTAFGVVPVWGEDRVGEAGGLDAAAFAGAEEVREAQMREAGGWSEPSLDEGTAARLLSGLMRNPAALELLLQAADPEVLEEARGRLFDRMIERSGGKVH